MYLQEDVITLQIIHVSGKDKCSFFLGAHYQVFLGQLVEPAVYCSGYMNEAKRIIGPFDIHTGETGYPGLHGIICPVGQMCIEDPANNPNYGFVNYDTIFHSFLSVYTTVSLELWTDLLYQTQEAESAVAALYYCLAVYIISFVLSFLLFGKTLFEGRQAMINSILYSGCYFCICSCSCRQ